MFENLYSPVQKLNYHRHGNLFVKRDDLIDPYISGNKWRKLKYLLQDANRQNKNHLVTFGGAYSNHLVATAAAAAKFGYKATAFVRGEVVKNEMLLICSLYGMQLIFVDRERYKHKQELYNEHFAADSNCYFIDEGGASAVAVQGCAEIITELPTVYDHIFVAAGTGTTAAGLLSGIHTGDLKSRLHVVPVLKGGDFIGNEIAKYTPLSNHLKLHTNYHFGGYAKTTPELLDFIKSFINETGVLIDPIYTAKLFYAITDLCNKQVILPNENILAIHTGGLLGLLGKKELLW
ncbi:1-aminocyclopropane-1-carboxylate deaminase/D-cysteine desulfhydrase [Pedobacter sandarakinus]|uniref:1-aminocyclopropane-1-carboxylate deaminase/D-cysteine desulfhydrase n=1 Tax=Pedobacter sandarakinus TaxID=353156 RepID=UPI002245CEE7|nr:pyridoxal-phosphate dependent enzyme [Pedobacter sandarakinus]MCX2574640.1 pyridoxal-phosphate dependent enzyme [Pedobacter sandarakinus]